MSKEIDYENLSYPMFETTISEKVCLVWVLILYYLHCDRSQYLCHNLRYRYGYSLIPKIQGCLGSYHSLHKYFSINFYDINRDQHKKLRKIWIRRLLSYNPPALELQSV